MRDAEITGLDQSATRALSNEKGKFMDANREAKRLLRSEALMTPDRILGMQHQVIATILVIHARL